MSYPEGLHFDKEHAIAIALVDLHRENVIDFKRIVSYVKQFQEHEKGDM